MRCEPGKRLASGGCQPELKSSRRDTTTCQRHISHCVSNISNFRKEIFHFPEGKISPGGAKFFAPPYGRPLRFPYGHEKELTQKGELFLMVTPSLGASFQVHHPFHISASKSQNLPRASSERRLHCFVPLAGNIHPQTPPLLPPQSFRFAGTLLVAGMFFTLPPAAPPSSIPVRA